MSSRKFSYWNLIIHIVCRHYVYMTYVKFFEEIDHISTSRDIIFYISKTNINYTKQILHCHMFGLLNYSFDLKKSIHLDCFLLLRLMPLMTLNNGARFISTKVTLYINTSMDNYLFSMIHFSRSNIFLILLVFYTSSVS